MYNNMNGYAPYRSSSGGRMWGMSHSLPSGMDTDFTSSYPAGAGFGGPGPGMFSGPQRNSRGMYNDFQANNALGQMGHMASSTSNLAGPGGGIGNGPPPVGCSGTNLIVNYLPQDMQDRELYSLFRTIGPINTCRIMRDLKVSDNTGYSFGYAFVDFCNEADAVRAIKSLNGITVRTKRLKVSYARPGGDCLKDTNLYVTNLPRTITEDQLDIIFGKYGQIVQKNILRDKLTGKPRGVAFVRFNKREEAQEAISALNNVIPEGGMQPLTVRVAEEHGKQKAHVYLGGGGGGLQTPMYNNIMHRGRQKVTFFKKVHPYNPNYL